MPNPARTTSKQSVAVVGSLIRPLAEHPPAARDQNPGSRSLVEISPIEVARRRSAAWPGFRAETVEIMRHTTFEYGFQAPCHLLIAAEVAERYDGETFVEGLPRSTLRDFTQKLTFVPAGHDFRGWQRPRALTRVTYVYIDPRGPLADPALRFEAVEFKPRLFFYDRDLWQTAMKLKSVVDNSDSVHRQYAEALGVVLTHELVRINGEVELRRSVSRGGLACWQRKRVATYIEEHVADDVPLATLAELARLSPYHFSRSFKHSFGVPPHRYHATRRIERAKQLLANRDLSVTTIALRIGFSDTSSFTAAFHRVAGETPSHYRRNLD
ncbi:helix-turn-helix domain-containing protein [Bradyrhizobium sp. Bra64]|uniref:helix-turn-helix domain-containing protein n=1 Tax=Bradyrhizobium sp. Bra64 TaxID=2926009 RepID=UPI00211868C1|nr:AraC family transcriptional regulator [Bradyrhizobium sp. Bra64]